MTATDFDRDLLSPLLSTVIGRSGVGVVVFDDRLRYVFANEVAAELHGMPSEDHAGRSFHDVAPGIARNVAPIIRRALDEDAPLLNVEVEGHTQDTVTARHWMASIVPYCPAGDADRRLVAAVFVEITRQRQAQHRLTQLIDGLFTFVGLCAPDGTLLEVNETALCAAQLRRDEVVGRPFWETYWWSHSSSVQDQLHEAVLRAAEGHTSRYDVQVRIGGGELITIDFQLVPIVEAGAVAALVPSGLDITDRVAERGRLEAMARLSRMLNGAVRTEEVARLAAEHGPAVVGADEVHVGLLDRERRYIQFVLPPVNSVIAERWSTMPVDGPRTPFHDAIDTGEAVYLDGTDRPARFPHLVEDATCAGIDTSASMPLRDSDGTIFGVLGVGWRRRSMLSDETRARLTVLADLCSQAMQRARITEARDSLVHDLQDEILSAWEPPEGLDVAAAYRPANDELGFGGDWYDVISLGAGSSVFVVGDVAGHGTPAAARMTATKATIRAFATAFAPAEVVPRSTTALDHLHSGYIATVALAWIDLAAQRLQWCLAGHPPPVLRAPDGQTRLLAGVHHPPIGLTVTPVELSAVDFVPGSVLVLYTDGLVERRDADIDERLEVLRLAVERAPAGRSSAELCDELVATLADDTDDVALIVIQYPVDGAPVSSP